MYTSWLTIGRSQPGQRGRVRQTLHGLQPMDDRQPVGVLRGQLTQGTPEDDGVLVAVGVDQHHPAAALGQCRLTDRHHRRDTAARGQQQEVGVQCLGHEGARRREHMDPHAGMGVVAQPVRGVTAVGALDGDGQRVTGERRTAQRIAPGHRPRPVAGHPQGQELPRRVAQSVCGDLGTVGHGEHQRARVVGLLDDLGHLQFQHVATERLVRHAVPLLSSITRTGYRNACVQVQLSQECPARHKS